ncbi:uncharacterized mitochondrial protein AtMg00810-like [Phragmites australis]|uniref:uncharacterized mitochondrial protein AtMg00810-like n=1 Tax=Phragmites australis TaxID=29695 RepID=UPI002D7769CD|nr:uncharacterized mitochondrial protein AtMg00810-like [Phragmites australis]
MQNINDSVEARELDFISLYMLVAEEPTTVDQALKQRLYRRSDGDTLLLVGVYVDDLIIIGSSVGAIDYFKLQMKRVFNMCDLCLLAYYLGMEVKQEARGISLCQSSYAGKHFELVVLADCNSCMTLMESKVTLTKKEDAAAVDATKYWSIVGSLRYLVNTRVAIAFAVGLVSRFMEPPTVLHMAAVKHMLRYVRGTLGFVCCYRHLEETEVKLVGYSDNDFASDADDRRSTSGEVFFLGRSLITWASQKQKITALSSCEAEYISVAIAACQGIWLSRLISDLTGAEPMKFWLLVDNKSAIELCRNPIHHDRSKHIDTHFYFIRECANEDKVDIEHVRIEDQVADILTKSLRCVKFAELRQKMGVVEVKMA